jgi:sugar phosphate isomerase/epimerase
MIQIGFSMHPNWARGLPSLRAFLDPLQEAGLTALEFELDSNDPTWPEFQPLMEACRELGYRLCFHAPYRPPSTIAGFTSDKGEEIAQSLAPLYDIAAQHGPATIVVHGAKSGPGAAGRSGGPAQPMAGRGSGEHARDLLYADTVAFLDWVLEQYPTLSLALENLNPSPDVIKIGDSRAELLHIVREIEHPDLGICWDIGHDVNAGRVEVPGPVWLRQVQHVHIHDLDDEGQDHLPLIYGRVRPEHWLPPLIRTGFDGIITLELNGRRCGFLWPDRTPPKRDGVPVMPALVNSIAAIADAIRGAEQIPMSRRSGSGEEGA